jgi:hypothetical protein
MNSRRYVSSHASFGILAVLISHSHAQVIFRCACRVVFFNDHAAITFTIQADATGLPTELEEEYQGRFFDNTPDGDYVRRHLHSLFLLSLTSMLSVSRARLSQFLCTPPPRSSQTTWFTFTCALLSPFLAPPPLSNQC